MIRIIKLYKYVSKTSEFKEPQKVDKEEEDEEITKPVGSSDNNPSIKLCRTLSDMATRKVIIIGCLLMFVLPLLTYSQDDYSGDYGLRELFWFGRSSCTSGFYCSPSKSWVTKDGWYELLRLFVNHKIDQGSNIPILWIYIPDYNQGGKMAEIKSIPNVYNNGTFWTEDPNCAGFLIDQDKCDLRISEMDIISYTPLVCTNGAVDGCEETIAYFRFNIRSVSQDEASFQFYTTIFTCTIITIGSILFNSDTQKIVNKPISIMVRRILDIINNFKNPESLINEKEESSHMKTKMLGLTVYKIALLLRRGFGEIGIKIIEDKVSMSDDEDDSLLPGKKKYATFLLVRITQFNQITDILQEEIIVFVNKIVRILHESVRKWDGIANKNYGDKYLITWLLSEDYYHNITEMTKKLERKAKRAEEKLLGVDQNEIEQAIKLNEMAKENSDDSENEIKKKKKKKGKKNKKEEEEKKKREEEQRQKELEEQKKREEEENKIFIDESIQEKADRTLVTAIKVISEIKRASDLAAYASHPKLGPKFNNFRAKISCVMHVGWLIEGPVGSNFKIDALYLSPAITVCTKLQYLCEEVYDCSIMMTEDFKNCLSPTSLMLKFTRPPPEEEPDSEPIKISSQSLRIVDRVYMKCKGIPMDLYSFDIQIPEVDVVAPENHQLGDLIVIPEVEEYEDIEKVKKFPLSYMFSVDEDVYTLQKHRFGNDFYVEYNEALEAYIDGEWEYAIESIDKCLLIDPNDGPCKEMRRFMKDENNSKTPKKWMGYRTFLFEEQSAQPFGESEGSAQFQDEEEDEEASESDP